MFIFTSFSDESNNRNIERSFVNNFNKLNLQDSTVCFEIIKTSKLFNKLDTIVLVDTTTFYLFRYYSKLISKTKESLYFDDVVVEINLADKLIIIFNKALNLNGEDILNTFDLIGLSRYKEVDDTLILIKYITECKPPFECKVKEFYFDTITNNLIKIKSVFKEKYVTKYIVMNISHRKVINEFTNIRRAFFEDNKLINQFKDFKIQDLRITKR
jgi:hypothetical protein